MIFRSKCPLDTQEKTWTEFRLQWMGRVMGTDQLKSAKVVVPTEEFFPSVFRETQAEIEQYGHVICQQLGVSDTLQYEVGDAQMVGVPARLVRDQSTILIADSELRDPVFLVSAMAHELSRHLLLSQNYQTGEEADFESVVDLLTVFRGLGVFSANAISSPLAPDALPRRGYLSSRVVGYALALFAWVRGEDRPSWQQYLRHDATDSMNRSLKYLSKAKDCVFEPAAPPDMQRWSVGRALEELTAKSASHRLAALWYLKGHGDYSQPVSEGIQRCLRDSDVAVRRAAAALVPSLEGADADLQDDLLDAIRDNDAQVRAHAARALGAHGFSGPDVELGLEPLLSDPSRDVLLSTATTLADIGVTDEATVARLGKRFRAALVECNYGFAQMLAEPLGKMHGDINEFAKEFFANDPELFEQAESVLAEINAPDPDATV